MTRWSSIPRRTVLWLAATGAMALAACSDTSRTSSATAPIQRSAANDASFIGPTDGGDPIAFEVITLVPTTSLQEALKLLSTAELKTPGTSQSAAMALIDLVLRLHAKSELNGEGQRSVDVSAQIAKLIHDLYTLVGLTPPTLDARAFAATGAVQLVHSATGGIVRTGDNRAGILLRPGATSQDVLVVIERLDARNVLPTSLPTSAPRFEFSTFPKQTFKVPAVIQIRDIGPVSDVVAPYVVIAHPSTVVAGLIAVQPTVACPAAFSSFTARTVPSGGTLLAQIGALFSVRELYAATTVQPTQCASATDLSPHAAVTIYDPAFDVKNLKVVGGCGGNVRVRNSSTGDIVVRYTGDDGEESGWLTLPPGGAAHGKSYSETSLRARSGGHMRIYYGPKLLNRGGDDSCDNEE